MLTRRFRSRRGEDQRQDGEPRFVVPFELLVLVELYVEIRCNGGFEGDTRLHFGSESVASTNPFTRSALILGSLNRSASSPYPKMNYWSKGSKKKTGRFSRKYKSSENWSNGFHGTLRRKPPDSLSSTLWNEITRRKLRACLCHSPRHEALYKACTTLSRPRKARASTKYL